MFFTTRTFVHLWTNVRTFVHEWTNVLVVEHLAQCRGTSDVFVEFFVPTNNVHMTWKLVHSKRSLPCFEAASRERWLGASHVSMQSGALARWASKRW
jgi:hypothetical protein